jgi:hypothetical protein
MDYSNIALERLLGFTHLPSRGIDLPPLPIQSPTFENFISIQPEWRRSLLQILDHDLPFDDVFHYSDVYPVTRLGSVTSSVSSLLKLTPTRRYMVREPGSRKDSESDYILKVTTEALHPVGTYFRPSDLRVHPDSTFSHVKGHQDIFTGHNELSFQTNYKFRLAFRDYFPCDIKPRYT